jgi:hypothetical protein
MWTPRKGQRLAQRAAVHDLLDAQMRGVVLAHQADLHEPPAKGNLRIDDLPRLRRAERQRLLAEHRLARGDAGAGQRGVEAIRRGDQHGLHVGMIDQRVGVGEGVLCAASRGHLLQPRRVHIRQRHDLRRAHFVGQVADVAATHAAGSDHADAHPALALVLATHSAPP